MEFLSKYRDPVGDFAFHSTQRRHVDAILEEGVRGQKQGLGDVGTIEEVLAEVGFEDPFPFDRSTATYCHIDPAYVEETFHSVREPGVASEEVVVVAEVAEVEASIYLADMSVISDLIDYRYFSVDAMIQTDSPEEVVERYKNSIVEVTGPADIAANAGPDRGHAELVVDGDIAPTSIVDVYP